MSDPAIRFAALRARIIGRILATAVPSTIIVAYLLGLIMELSGIALLKALLFILAPLLVGIVLVVYGVVTVLLKRALTSVPADAEGARLRRILELPRRIEMIPYAIGWVIGAASFALIGALVFKKSLASTGAGAVAGLFAALFLGPMLTMMLEDDLREIAVEEFHRSPKVKLPSRGLFWVRQRWYLPYAFAVAIVSMVVFSGIVIVKKYDEAVANLLRAIEAHGLGGARDVVRAELERLVVSAGIPVATIVGILLAAFGIIGWMLARRQARAAAAVEESLRAMAAGSSRLPGWISTDEMGDLALATAGVASELHHVFDQLRAMAAGDLTRELQGDSGLIGAFRESQGAMLQLARRMIALSRGDLAEQAVIPGDLGRHFDELQRAFRATVDQAQTIAQGDLRADVEIPGALGNAIERMTSNLRSMVGQTQAVSSSIGDIVVSLQSAASQLSAATTEQVAAVTETANTMTEMAQTSAVSADRASELIKQGESASQVVEEGGEAAESTVQAMAAISAALAKVSSASASLADRVKRIDSITETVSFLADQSSTLAINAAIEAARAGESGKGFAVVAREIRTLASDSRKATNQIKELLAEIRDRTQQVDAQVVAGGSTVEDGNRLVQRLGEVIGQLGVTLHDAVGLMRQVEGSARQHQAGVGQVSQALTNMQKASESIRDGARLLGSLSSKAHEMSQSLKAAAGAYSLPDKA